MRWPQGPGSAARSSVHRREGKHNHQPWCRRLTRAPWQLWSKQTGSSRLSFAALFLSTSHAILSFPWNCLPPTVFQRNGFWDSSIPNARTSFLPTVSDSSEFPMVFLQSKHTRSVQKQPPNRCGCAWPIWRAWQVLGYGMWRSTSTTGTHGLQYGYLHVKILCWNLANLKY